MEWRRRCGTGLRIERSRDPLFLTPLSSDTGVRLPCGRLVDVIL